MSRIEVRVLIAAVAVAASACGDPPTMADHPLEGLPRAGGDTTTADRSSHAFENPAPNLPGSELERFFEGDLAFEQTFVAAPADVNPGLGPVFNHVACAGCHVRNGRGRPVAGSGPLRSPLLVRVSLPASDGDPAVPGGQVPVPDIGTQIGDHAIFGSEPEAIVELGWSEVEGEFGDGEAYTLLKPRYEITLPDGSPLAARVMRSARTPPAVFGLGLLSHFCARSDAIAIQ